MAKVAGPSCKDCAPGDAPLTDLPLAKGTTYHKKHPGTMTPAQRPRNRYKRADGLHKHKQQPTLVQAITMHLNTSGSSNWKAQKNLAARGTIHGTSTATPPF